MDETQMDWDTVNFTIMDYVTESSSTSNSVIKIVLAVLLYGLVTFLAMASNTIVIWTVCARKSMHSAANFLIVSIAIADSLMAVLYVPLYPMSLMKITWPFSNISCILFEMIAITTLPTVQISLIAVSIVWFKIIVCPSQMPLTKCEGVKIAIAIWTLSLFIGIPNWLTARADIYEADAYCVSYWPWPHPSYVETFYFIFNATWTYFIPAVWLIGTFIIISDKLFRTYSLVGRSYDDVDSLKHNKQSVKMMIVVIAIQLTALCPIIVIQIASKLYGIHFSEIVLKIAHWIAITTTMWKPIIYLIMCTKFRRNVKKTFRWFPCIRYDDY